MARNCPSCGRANDDDARFCSGCGTELVPAGPQGDAEQQGGGRPPQGNLSPAAIALIVVLFIAAAVAAAAIWWTFVRHTGDDRTPTPTPVASASPAVSSTPAPSATGYLAAVVGRQANALGSVAADGAVRQIAASIGPRFFSLAYSPDGRRIAVVAGTYKLRQLSIVALQNGNAVTSVHITAPVVVGVDSVAWLSSSDLLISAFTTRPKSQGENGDLLIYHPADGSVQPLTDSAGARLRGVEVSAARDGSRVVFVTYTDQKVDKYGKATAVEHLELLDRFSGDVKELGADKAYFDVNARRFDAPLISPTGQAVIFRRAGSDVGTSYTVMSASGATLMPAKELLYPAGYAWDPAGTRVVFTGQPVDSNGSGKAPVSFYLFDTARGGAPKVIATYSKTFVQDLAWSPDGSAIVWAEWDKTKYRSGNLFLMPASGGDSKRLADWAIMPAWAPGAKATATPAASPSP